MAAQSLVEQFSALGDPTRLKVLVLLAEKPRPVHDLAAAFDISRPAISRHLKVLKDAGLVKEEKQGRENLYALQRARLKPMETWLEKHRATPAAKPRSTVKAAAEAKPKASKPVRVPKTEASKPVSQPPVAPASTQLDLF